MIDINLWPDVPPGSAGLQMKELIEERSTAPEMYQDRAISCVSRPRISIFKPDKPNGCSVLIAPGGGYQRVVWDKEGVDIARWLNALGVTAGVLVYRLPAEGHRHFSVVPLQDAQRGLRLLRQHAAQAGLDATKVGAMGFSAGGHLVASLATRFAEDSYAQCDAADALSARPDFLVLGYPVISMREPIAHAGSRERLLGPDPDDNALSTASAEECVGPRTPTAFIFLPDDDAAVSPANGVNFYTALHEAGVSAELHVFRKGGHGFGIRQAQGAARSWTTLCEHWLTQSGYLCARAP